jgi:uncharacterized membrane protein
MRQYNTRNRKLGGHMFWVPFFLFTTGAILNILFGFAELRQRRLQRALEHWMFAIISFSLAMALAVELDQ